MAGIVDSNRDKIQANLRETRTVLYILSAAGAKLF
jgi:hypothetical protein